MGLDNPTFLVAKGPLTMGAGVTVGGTAVAGAVVAAAAGAEVGSCRRCSGGQPPRVRL